MKHRKGNNMVIMVLAFALVMVLVYFTTQPSLEGMAVTIKEDCLPDGKTRFTKKKCIRGKVKNGKFI
jgi:hypothetical protein